jgi:transposase
MQFVLESLAKHDLISGKTVGIEPSPLEANAAIRSIVRKDTNESYQEFLTRPAKESGTATPTREELSCMDKRRKHKSPTVIGRTRMSWMRSSPS